MVKVSIIIPVYNVEKYLARCLDSVTNQSFSDIEIICVNDGSTDNSLDILEHYSLFDSRIKIINQENKGLSAARNTGIKASIGKYILFIDSDDYISSIAVERLYNNAEHNNSDVVVFDLIWGKENFENCTFMTIEELGTKYTDKTFCIDTLPPEYYKKFPVTAFSKLYNTDFLKINNIAFLEGVIYEDIPFFAEIYTKAKRITYLPEYLYYYTIDRDGSIMSRDDEKLFDIIKVHEKVKDTLKTNGYWEILKPTIQLLMMMDYLKRLKNIRTDLKEKLFNTYKALPDIIDFDLYEGKEFYDFERDKANLYKLMCSTDYATFMMIAAGRFNV